MVAANFLYCVSFEYAAEVNFLAWWSQPKIFMVSQYCIWIFIAEGERSTKKTQNHEHTCLLALALIY